MKKVIILGAGFAGISAANHLSDYRGQLEIILIDKKQDFNFLPMLPDVIGNRINPEFLCFNLKEKAEKLKIKFINAFVEDIYLSEKKILCKGNEIKYDYLILATGSETNFYKNTILQEQAIKLDNLEDAVLILKDLSLDKYDNFIIFGGGYTGIEIATNFWRYFSKNKLPLKPIVIVEKTAGLLGRLPPWMQKYVQSNLRNMGIKIFTNTEFESFNDGTLKLKNNQIFKKAYVVWAAGVKAPELLKIIGIKTAVQGKAVVDEYLRVNSNCFCVGDSAFIENNGQPLRMGVQFAIEQGGLAARNVIQSLKRKKLKKYYPIDLGYIIPMANNKACGFVLGRGVKGLFAIFFHYLMCIFRSFYLHNKFGIIRDLFRNG